VYEHWVINSATAYRGLETDPTFLMGCDICKKLAAVMRTRKLATAILNTFLL
jgi:hypothetical protein